MVSSVSCRDLLSAGKVEALIAGSSTNSVHLTHAGTHAKELTKCFRLIPWWLEEYLNQHGQLSSDEDTILIKHLRSPNL